MINDTTHILKFRDFLAHSWADLDSLMENHNWDDDGSFTIDWIQVNWEFLVERQLLEKKGPLKSYFNWDFRITQPKAIATHEIICKPKSNKQFIDDRSQIIIPHDTTLEFGGFITRRDPGYGYYPPFDYLTLHAENRKYTYKVLVDDVDFFLSKIEDSA